MLKPASKVSVKLIRGFNMPKMKTKKGAKKRFLLRKSGGIKRWSANRNHILTKRSRRQKLRLKPSIVMHRSMISTVRKLLRLK